jgi:hypothetical protein
MIWKAKSPRKLNLHQLIFENYCEYQWYKMETSDVQSKLINDYHSLNLLCASEKTTALSMMLKKKMRKKISKIIIHRVSVCNF